jgi:hypothetical protein
MGRSQAGEGMDSETPPAPKNRGRYDGLPDPSSAGLSPPSLEVAPPPKKGHSNI